MRPNGSRKRRSRKTLLSPDTTAGRQAEQSHRPANNDPASSDSDTDSEELRGSLSSSSHTLTSQDHGGGLRLPAALMAFSTPAARCLPFPSAVLLRETHPDSVRLALALSDVQHHPGLELEDYEALEWSLGCCTDVTTAAARNFPKNPLPRFSDELLTSEALSLLLELRVLLEQSLRQPVSGPEAVPSLLNLPPRPAPEHSVAQDPTIVLHSPPVSFPFLDDPLEPDRDATEAFSERAELPPGSQVEILPVPNLLVGFDSRWIEVLPSAFHVWDCASLQPYAPTKDICYYVLIASHLPLLENARFFFQELSATYSSCNLGVHLPAVQLPRSSGPPTPVPRGSSASFPGFVSVPITGVESGDLSAFLEKSRELSGVIAELSQTPSPPPTRPPVSPAMPRRDSPANSPSPAPHSLPGSPLAASGSGGSGGEPISDDRCPAVPMIVVYIVNSFSDSSVAGLARSLTPLQSVDSSVRNASVVLQYINAESIMYRDFCASRMKEISFSVYSRSRRHYLSPLDAHQPMMLYEPLAILAGHRHLWWRPRSPMPTDITLHGAYCIFTTDSHQRFVKCVLTDQNGELLETFGLKIDNRGYDDILSCVLQQWLQVIHAGNRSLTWSLIITRSGVCHAEEIAAWRSVVSRHRADLPALYHISVASLEDCQESLYLQAVSEKPSAVAASAPGFSRPVQPKGVSSAALPDLCPSPPNCMILLPREKNDPTTLSSVLVFIKPEARKGFSPLGYKLSLNVYDQLPHLSLAQPLEVVRSIGHQLSALSWLNLSVELPGRLYAMPFHLVLLHRIIKQESFKTI